MSLVKINKEIKKQIDKEILTNKKRFSDSQKYLTETDWYVVRKMETGQDIPEEVLEKRKIARESL